MVKLDRTEVRYINRDWVKDNCKSILTDRDMELLKVLNKKGRRLLRRDQIQSLMPGVYPNEDRLQKRLKRLYDVHIIDRICPKVGLGEGSSQQYVCLDRAGAILLGDAYNKSEKMIQYDEDGNKYLQAGWRHRVAINDYEILVRGIVRELGGKIITRIEEPVPYGNNRIEPDLTFLVAIKGNLTMFFIEVDRATEDVKFIAKKYEKYSACYRYKQWQNMWWAKMWAATYEGKVPFPKTLFFTEERPRRIKTLRDKIPYNNLVPFVIDSHENAEKIIESTIKGSL